MRYLNTVGCWILFHGNLLFFWIRQNIKSRVWEKLGSKEKEDTKPSPNGQDKKDGGIDGRSDVILLHCLEC